MTLPFDQELAKLRLLLQRAAREAAAEQKKYDEIVKAAYKPLYEANEAAGRASCAYYARAKQLGYCGNCEKPLSECGCILLAAPTNSGAGL